MTPSLPLWKLTRTATARRLYESIVAMGVRVAFLDEFVSDLRGHPQDETDARRDISVRVVSAEERLTQWVVDDPGLEPGDVVLVALADGAPAGSVLVSPAGSTYIEPLDRTILFDGGYLWGLSVDPAWRRRGIGWTLVTTALEHLAAAGAPTAHALVAPDNRPSRSLFRKLGFAVSRRYGHVDAFGRSFTAERTLERSASRDPNEEL